MNKKKTWILIILGICIMLFSGGCSVKKTPEKKKVQVSVPEQGITIGFSQTGSESIWRIANTFSMMNTFSKEKGYNLRISNGEGSQQKQIKALELFIKEKVDYIVLSPIKETGWTSILKKAKKAKIPVIIADRMIKTKDTSLYTAWVGSDFMLEGWKACEWLNRYQEEKGISEYRIVEIRGTEESSAQIGRTESLRQSVKEQESWKFLGYEQGNFTRTIGKRCMKKLIERFGNQINVVYCENDDEALGAIEALEEKGFKVGGNVEKGEVMVISFDCTKDGLRAVLEKKIMCDVECNPLHGPRIAEIINMLARKQRLEKLHYITEDVFVADDTVQKLVIDSMEYPVTKMTKSIFASRAY